MKEVKFRWIDQYLIHMTLKTKFAILATVPVIMLLILAFVLNVRFSDTLVQSHLDRAATQVDLTNQVVTQALSLLPEDKHQSFLQSLPFDTRVESVNSIDGKSAQLARKGGGTFEERGQYKVVSSVGNSQYVTIQSISSKDIQLSTDDNLLFVGGAVAACLIIIFLFSYYISTFVGGALYTTVMALKRAADGDLASRLNFFEVKDEFSILAVSIDTLVERQHNLVKNISSATSQIRNVVDAFRNNARNGQALAANQRAHLDSLATAMEEMTAAVREVAGNAERSSLETQEANQQVAAGSADIATTVAAIGQLSNEIATAADAVTVLNENASRIDEVVTTINAISEQTNLLALNAAIEA
ncbi:methyl-accepting chemotaxis protein, partial [Shewanella sp.]|uniref:methyl-accepting chemotaxis protein n=1 Tax=Shewanella sp. TaxID=50422 RepID=UPI003561957F